MRPLYLTLISLVLPFAVLAKGTLPASPNHTQIVVAPPSWWVGMQNSQLQLLVSSPALRSTTPMALRWQLAANKGVTLLNASPMPNSQYWLLNLDIDATAPAQQLQLSVTLPGQTLAFAYALQNRQPQSRERAGFSSKDVIYLAMPDRFSNGDPSNDSVPTLLESAQHALKGGRHGGDLQGVINQLPALAELGISQLWLTPVLENNQASYSYHGYSATNFYQVDARLGSNQQYQQLVRDANALGIGVIHDVVLNHCGSGHPWLVEPPSDDWFNHNEWRSHNGPFVATNHARQTLQDPHAARADQQQFNDGWFVETMPDLNQRHPVLANYLIQNSIWWIEYAGLSGLRVDTYSYSDRNFLKNWGERVLAEYPKLNIVGEEWSTNPAIVSYWQQGKVNHDGYQPSLPTLMDFPLQQALMQALTEPESWQSGLIKLYQSLANDFLYPEPLNLLVFADNHDMARSSAQLHNDAVLSEMALGYVLTTRGIPQLFYGSEWLMTHPGNDHGDIRQDWQQHSFAHADPTSQNFYQKIKALIAIRHQYPELQTGQLRHFSPQQGLYVYFRYLPNSKRKLMIILNKNAITDTLPLARFHEMWHGDATLTPLYGDVSIIPQSASAASQLQLAAKSISIVLVSEP